MVAMLGGPFIDESYDDPVGKTLGKYEITEYLGYGGMATVYKAHHPLLNRDVAIKLLHEKIASDYELVAQFVNEARNLAILQHPNIIQVYDIDVEDSKTYIVMEFIKGGSLKQEIEKNYENKSKFELSKSIRMIQYMGTALSYAHKQNVIHRDVKPSNVMIEDTGRVVLADFGLAKLRTGITGSLSNTVQGTPAYMSPEQGMGLSGGEMSDIYSLGAVFYELVTGQQPFRAQNPFEVVMKHINDPLPPPSDVWPEVPARLEAVIIKAMEKIPHDRYETVDAMLEDINNLDEEDTKKQLTATLSLSEDVFSDSFMPVTNRDTQVSLHIVDTGQIMLLERGKKYLLGRANTERDPDIDLTPFSAYEWGISRLHAELEVKDEVTIKDLESANGTWYEGKKIAPWQTVTLSHGEVVSLGKLKLQILIYS